MLKKYEDNESSCARMRIREELNRPAMMGAVLVEPSSFKLQVGGEGSVPPSGLSSSKTISESGLGKIEDNERLESRDI